MKLLKVVTEKDKDFNRLMKFDDELTKLGIIKVTDNGTIEFWYVKRG